MYYIYHHTDADGYASAAVVITYLKLCNKINDYNSDNVKLIPFNYNSVNTFVPFSKDDFKENDTIYIVDISVSYGTLDKFILFIDLLYKRKCKLVWIDHHKSSDDEKFRQLLDSRFKVYDFEKYVDISYCAAYNCYTYFMNKKLGFNYVPEILRIIDDYDCWKLKLKGSKEFIVGFSLNNRHDPSNSDWYAWLTNRGSCLSCIKECITKGEVVNKWLLIDDTNKYKLSAFDTTLFDLKCCALNCRRNSDIFRTEQFNYDILLSYIYDGENYIYSIYSVQDNVDCSKIAEYFGGGGHKGAAGFKSKKLVVNKKRTIFYKLKEFYRKLKLKRR